MLNSLSLFEHAFIVLCIFALSETSPSTMKGQVYSQTWALNHLQFIFDTYNTFENQHQSLYVSCLPGGKKTAIDFQRYFKIEIMKLTIIWFGGMSEFKWNLNTTLLMRQERKITNTEAKRAITEIKQQFSNWQKPCFWMGKWHITRPF